MVTKLFPRDVVFARGYSTGNNDANLRGTVTPWTSLQLSTIAGPTGVGAVAVSSNTVAGPTAGVEIGSNPVVWYSLPLAADVTISGSITWNIWASESSTSANVAINGRIDKVDSATGAITVIDTTARTTEVALTTRAVNNFAKTPAVGVLCKKGDRLRVRIFGDDAGTMATGFTFTIGYNAGTAAADGDTYLILTENLTFITSEPAGSLVYLTDAASAATTASVDQEAWTSRGGSTATAVTSTVTGWGSPVQVTNIAGGTVIDWFTRPLTAFTLGGAVRVNIRGRESSGSANTAIRCEIARVAGDGTGATAWAQASNILELTTTDAAQSFIASGPDLAITNGQRLRIRILLDDLQDANTVTGFTVTVSYSGTTDAAAGDTFLIFSQTLNEYSVANPSVPFNRDNRLVQHLAR